MLVSALTYGILPDVIIHMLLSKPKWHKGKTI